MFGFLKNLLQRSPSEAPDDHGPEFQAPTPSPAPARTYASAAPTSRPPVQNGKSIELPVQKILEGLPLELQPRIRQLDPGALTISVPLEKVLAQLSRGVVKVSFGELRQAVPDIFTAENDRDRVMVALPLAEVLSRLNPALITRRRAQQTVEVPAEIASPFDLNGGGFFSYAGSPAPAEPAPAAAPTRVTRPAAASPAAPNRGTLKSVSTPIPPPTLPLTPSSRQAAAPPPAPVAPEPASTALPEPPIPFRRPAPAAPVPPPRPPSSTTTFKAKAVPSVPAPRPSSSTTTFKGKAPTAPQKAAPAHTPPPASTQPATAPSLRLVRETAANPPTPAPSDPASIPAPPPAAPVAQAPVSAAPSAPPPKPASPPVVLPLSALAEGWPEPVRKELVDLNLVDAQVALPASAVEQSLKQGRIVFSWKTLRAWIKPAVLATQSPHDGTVLELPLKVVAPAFLTRPKDSAHPQEKVAVDEEIPNLFFGAQQAEAQAAAVTAPRPADTNFYVWGDTSDTVMLHESEVKRGSTPGTKFVAKYATPNEVISRAAGLDGVAGALIALPDGLMVANQLPPELNGDTLAAFLPQIFGKVSQCTKELRMGELNNLNFTVGNVPWKIFRVNAIFFAAFGHAGEPLPTAQLAALAAELDHKPK